MLQILIAILLIAFGCQAESLQIFPVTADVVKGRMDRIRATSAERASELRSMFEEAGCRGEQLVQAAQKGARSNVVCTLRGDTDEMVIIGGHFDKVSQGQGAIDDWSGVSLLPSLYESLAKLQNRRFTWVLVGFADEETGLEGSKAFVKSLGKEGIAKVKAMVNLECLGLSPTKIWVNRSDPRLVNIMAALAKAVKSEVSGLNMDAVGDSDSHSFADKKIPVLEVHSLTQQSLALLHRPADQRSEVHDDWHYETYRLVAALVTWMDHYFAP